MKNLTPVPRDQRPPIPEFTPVPRLKPRHDGWTPERQRAFIKALADTGSVSTACRMVNMASEGAYALRRHPDAGEFRRAWQAALDMGVMRLKDEAFERAINGQLVPVFVAGKLLGFRRKKNDRLLMFCLRHYGQDQQGRRVTINYFSNRATAGVAEIPLSQREREGPAAQRWEGEGDPVGVARPRQAIAQATATTLTTTLAPAAPDRTAADDEAASTLATFEGVDLDPQAQADILAALEACAARRRALDPRDDTERAYVSVREAGLFAGELEGGVELAPEPFRDGEPSWENLDDKEHLAAVDAAVASVEVHNRLPSRKRKAIEAKWKAEAERQRDRQNPRARHANGGTAGDPGDWQDYVSKD